MTQSTRIRILEAARALVEAEGAAVSMERIADAADVSRRAVYLHFASRTELMVSLVAHVDETGYLAERARKVTEAGSGIEAMDAFVALNARYNAEIHGIARAIERARDTDESAAAAWDDRMSGRRSLCRWIAKRLANEDALRDEVSIDTTADLIWSLTNVPMWRDLVVTRGWSMHRYQQWVTTLLHSLLVESKTRVLRN